MMNAWEPSNINEVSGFKWSRKTMGQVNEFPLSVMDMRNQYLERWKISMKKISASICMKPSEHEHISKSHGAAELCGQIIDSIYDLLNAKGDITQGYLR